MTNEQEKQVRDALGNLDVADVMRIMVSGENRYNRRILKFFRWFCKYVPMGIMFVHMYGMYDFAHHKNEMVIPLPDNTPCYIFLYVMVYILPMVIVLASRFFYLCWRYRIPFIYYFGVNAIHIVHGSVFTTNEMIMSHYALMVMMAVIYAYALCEIFLETKVGRKFFS